MNDGESPRRTSTTPIGHRVRLVARSKPAPGLVVEVARGTFSIGREEPCHLILPDLAVSGQHAAIENIGPRVLLRDLDSTNGTLLNGRLLQNDVAELHDGDRLEITPFEFLVAIGVGQSHAEPSSLPPPWIHCPQCGHQGWVSFHHLLDLLLKGSDPPRLSPEVVPDYLLASAGASQKLLLEETQFAGDEPRADFQLENQHTEEWAPPEPSGSSSGSGSGIRLPRTRLLVEDEEERGRIIDITVPVFVIGRDPGCHLVLSDSAVSTKHAVILRESDRVVLQDLGSTNGTLVNNRLVHYAEVILEDGDHVEITPYHFSASLILSGEVAAASASSSRRTAPSPIPDDALTAPGQLRESERSDLDLTQFFNEPDDPADHSGNGDDFTLTEVVERGTYQHGGSYPARHSDSGGSLTSLVEEALEDTKVSPGASRSTGEMVAAPKPPPPALEPLPPMFETPVKPSSKEATAKPKKQPAAAKKPARPAGTETRRSFPVTALAALCGVSGLSFFALRKLLTPRVIPTELPQLTTYTAEAFLDESERALKELALPGTEEDLIIWLNKARQPGWRHGVDRSKPLTANIKLQDKPPDTALVYARFSMRKVSTSGAEFSNEFLPIWWRKGPDGSWKLDGTETKKATPRAARE